MFDRRRYEKFEAEVLEHLAYEFDDREAAEDRIIRAKDAGMFNKYVDEPWMMDQKDAAYRQSQLLAELSNDYIRRARTYRDPSLPGV